MNYSEPKNNSNCWVCCSSHLKLVKRSDVENSIDSTNFAITNSDYGKTKELSQCENCGFIQCTKENNVIHFYEDLIDYEYENTRKERKLQEQRILKIIQKIKPRGKLLDIGAGSGVMVEAALEMGYNATGIEPSRWLHEKATEKGLPIHLGSFPMDGLTKKYDVIALVDVIEHVNNPKDLLNHIRQSLKWDGILVIVTPDVNSIMAKLFKWKWWHFRVAHIGYFNKSTLSRITKSTSFKCIKKTKPAWYFSLEYLIERGYQYLPKYLRLPIPRFIKKVVIPLNLRDSLLGVYQIQEENN